MGARAFMALTLWKDQVQKGPSAVLWITGEVVRALVLSERAAM